MTSDLEFPPTPVPTSSTASSVVEPGLVVDERLALAHELALQFALSGPIDVSDFPGKGNINYQTFVIDEWTSGRRRSFLLQRINEEVFTQPHSVMTAMLACLDAQRTNLERGRLRPDEQWEPVTLVPTRQGDSYLEVREGPGAGCWRLMVRIENAVSYKSLGEITDPELRLMTAEQAGAGLALFGTLSEGINLSGLTSALPGYRDTRFYYDQLRSVLAECRTLAQAEPFLPSDPDVRCATERHFLVHLPADEYRRRVDRPEVGPFLELLRENEAIALLLARELEAGRIRSSVIHGDTKLENFLFDAASRRVRSLVDLDTIMAHTWLSDWGDMVRSFCNIAGEKEARLDLVQVDLDIFRAVARGFLRSARNVPANELAFLVDGAQIIALELGMRFLTDYLRGDSYFKPAATDPPELNMIRGRCQLTLFTRLRARDAELRDCVLDLQRDLEA